MTATTALSWLAPQADSASTEAPPKADWPLMSDVSTIRAGVPEALIHWRAARGETLPAPCDPYLKGR